MQWLLEKYKGLYDELYEAVYTYYEKKEVKKPQHLATTFVVFTLLFCVSAVVAMIVAYIINFENYDTFTKIILPVATIVLIFVVPLLGGLTIFYYGTLCVVVVDFFLLLIPSKKFQKVTPYISFFSGGILGVIIAIWIILTR